MHMLQDIITYIRRIIKAPSNASISDALLIDYINRFYISDVDARIQLFDLKTKYQFQTQPGVDKYNMPLYDSQIDPLISGSQEIGMYPVYQGFVGPASINGVPVALETQKNNFYNVWFNSTQNLTVVAIGDGTSTYTLRLPILPEFPFPPGPPNPPFPPNQGIVRGHVDITGIIALGTNIDPPLSDTVTALPSLTDVGSIAKVPVTSALPSFYITSSDATGANIVISDSGQFLVNNVNCGLLMFPGKAPNGNTGLSAGYSETLNTVNYFSGIVNIDISPVTIPIGQNINVQCSFIQNGLPRSILYYNNTLTLRSPPDRQYLVELDAYLTPAAFLSTTEAIPFGYMAEYIARGAARKILSDTGDAEQLAFYEPLFLEQESLVHIRSQRQWTANRTQTIYSQGGNQGYGGGFNNNGIGTLL